MIRNEVKILGTIPKENLRTIHSDEILFESFNFELNELIDLSSVYEITLSVESFNITDLKLKDSTLTPISFILSAKVLYSTSNNIMTLKDYLFPQIYNIKVNNTISDMFLIDCNLCINHTTISLSLLIGFLKEKPAIKIYKTKNYIKTISNTNFDSTFDFL